MPKKKSTSTKPLHVAFCLDMSGSMRSITPSVIEGFNDYVQQLKRDESVLTRLSLTVFDTVFEKWQVATPIHEFPDTALDNYRARGGTALYDAVATTIADVESSLLPNERVLIVVMTDGQENRSTEYAGELGRQRLAELVKDYEAKGWVFTYLGANVDAVQEATSMGMAAGNAVYYSASKGSTRSAMANLSSVTSGFRSGAISESAATNMYASLGLTNDVRDEQDASLSV